MRSIARTLKLFGIIGAVVLTLGCQNSRAADRITFVTDFGFNGRHAYYFVAKEKGFYAKYSLDVNIEPGKGSADAVQQVAAGTAQIGFADAPAVILGRGNDNVPVKLVAMVYAKAPHAIYVLADSGIIQPKDLEGKTIADTAFSAIPKLFDAYAKAAHIDASKVKWVVAAGTALPGLLSTGRVDGIGQYVVGEALLAQAAAPKKVRALTYADAGLDIYSNGIIASESEIKEHSKLVSEFVDATLDGLKYAVGHPEEAGEIMHKYHPEVDADIATAETKIVGTLIDQPGESLGYIDPEKMQTTLSIVGGAFSLKRPVTVSELYAPEFVKK